MRVFFLTPYEAKRDFQPSIDRIIRVIEDTGFEILSAEKSREYQDALSSPNIELFGNRENAHYEFTRQGILNSDAVIVEASVESFRVGHETTLAVLYKKPVLCLSQKVDYGRYIRYGGFEGALYTDDTVGDIVREFLARVTVDAVAAQSTTLFVDQERVALRQGHPRHRIAVMGFVGMDITTKVDTFPVENEAVISEGVRFSLGGKAANAAVAMSRLREAVTMVGKVGSDSFGSRIKMTLDLEGINTDLVFVDSFVPTGTVLVNVDRRGKNTVIVNEDANQRFSQANLSELIDELDSSGATLDCFYVTLESPQHVVREAILAMVERRIPIFCDPTSDPLLLDQELYGCIDILAPNQFEATTMTGIDVVDAESAERAAVALRMMGARNVIVTIGELGAVLLAENEKLPVHFDALSVRVTDETGAGDAFRAAFVVEFLNTGDYKRAMNAGVRAGAFAVTRLGSFTAMPTPEQLVALDESAH